MFFATHASYASTPFSKYGVIQNVQNYSTNPFWNPNSPYNQRMPQPVYVKGPQVTTLDCQQTVASLVASHCSAINNCANAQLTDIRPAIMVMLSRMPNGNYATSCGGYIDEAFNNFKAQYAPKIVHSGTAFPSAQNNATITIDTTPKTPTWATEVAERRQELEQLQTENGTNDFYIDATNFPTTYADLSFNERMANEAAGYEPYKDMRAYQEINIEDLDEYYNRQVEVAQAKKEYEKSMADLEKAEKCRKNPNDPDCSKGKDKEKARKEKCSKKENYGDPDCAQELRAYCIKNPTDTQYCDDNNGDEVKEPPVLTGDEHFMFLFQPDNAAWEKGEIETSKLSQRTFWDEKCSDHSYKVYIDDDSVINEKMSDVFKGHANTGNITDYFLYINQTMNVKASRDYQFIAYKLDYSGMLCHDGDIYEILTYTDLEEAKLKANAIQESLKDTKCNGLKLYIVTFPLPKNSSEIPQKITIVDGPFDIE